MLQFESPGATDTVTAAFAVPPDPVTTSLNLYDATFAFGFPESVVASVTGPSEQATKAGRPDTGRLELNSQVVAFVTLADSSIGPPENASDEELEL
jgi:hypothetical protein